LLADSRLTERVKFWSVLQRPIDQETVKINFLRKVNRKNPPFRRKVALPGRPRMQVTSQLLIINYLYLFTFIVFRFRK